jgi:hypothetical protein
LGGGALVTLFAQSAQKFNCRRVENITIVPETCTLHWTVSSGEEKDGQYTPAGKVENYEISLHKAQMTHDGVTVKFSPEEALAVHSVLMALNKYTVDSVTWFEDQVGPPQKAGQRTPGQRKPDKQLRFEERAAD